MLSIPILGLCICGPLAVVLNGIASGYFGVQWNTNKAGVGSGVLAGTISGIGILLGSLILFIGLWLFFRMISQENPELLRAAIEQAIRQQRTEVDITVEEVEQLMGLGLAMMGFCFGLLGLVLSLAFGAVGGWIATSRRPADPTAPTPFEPPSFGPPPLSPS